MAWRTRASETRKAKQCKSNKHVNRPRVTYPSPIRYPPAPTLAAHYQGVSMQEAKHHRAQPQTERGLFVWAHKARWALAASALAFLCACGGGTTPATSSAGSTSASSTTTSSGTSTTSLGSGSSTVSTTASISAAGGTLTIAGAKLEIPASALGTTTTLSISLSSTGAPSSAAGVTTTSIVFALLPHGTTFAQSVTLTVPFDPNTLPAGVTPRLYKAEVGGTFTEIPSTVVGTTLVAYISNFSWAQSGYTYAPRAPIVQVETDHQAARVTWEGVPGESYQVCQDPTPSSVIGTYYPGNCVAASPPYVTASLTNGTPYTFGVIASNSAGSASSAFANGTPKALGRTWAQPVTGYFDPYGCTYSVNKSGCAYRDVTYLRGKDRQDYFVAIKSTQQWMRVVGTADPVHIADAGQVLFEINSVAGGNGYFVAVGASGTIGVSGDYGRTWNFVQYTATGTNGDITYKSVAYVPDTLNRPGRFIAVGVWNDSSGQHDLVSTIDPAAGVCTGPSCSTSASAAVFHQKYSEYSGLAAVSTDGLILGGTSSGTYGDYSSGSLVSVPGGFSIKATGNLAAGTAAIHTLTRTAITYTNTIDLNYTGAQVQLFKVRGNYWAVSTFTSGQYSSDGLTWSGQYFQLINPYTQLAGIAAGPGQMVAATYIGDVLYNTTFGLPKTAWTTINSAVPNGSSGGYRKTIYGANRYMIVGSQIYISN